MWKPSAAGRSSGVLWLVLSIASLSACDGGPAGEPQDPRQDTATTGTPQPELRDLQDRVEELAQGQEVVRRSLSATTDRLEEFLQRLQEVRASGDGAGGSPAAIGDRDAPWLWAGLLLVALAAGWAVGRAQRQAWTAPGDRLTAGQSTATLLPTAGDRELPSNGSPSASDAPAVAAKIARRAAAPTTAHGAGSGQALRIELDFASAQPERARARLARWLLGDPRVLNKPAPAFEVRDDGLRVSFHLLPRSGLNLAGVTPPQ